MLGYEDVNDVTHLQHDPLFKDVLQGDLASQPTIGYNVEIIINFKM
jgi:hypothetical protein